MIVKTKKLSIFTVLLSVSILLIGCAQASSEADKLVDPSEISAETSKNDVSYIDSFIFLGESTTAHMKSRGVLSDGTNTRQVWSTESGTMCLDASIENVKILYTDGEGTRKLTIAEALTASRPERILLCFGLNGAIRNASGDGKYFIGCYKKLISIIRNASPDTEIIIQSCYPVAANMDTSAYGCDVLTLNSHIDKINSFAREFAAKENIIFFDTSEALKDENGMLKKEYQAGDGYHLTADAYRVVLKMLYDNHK